MVTVQSDGVVGSIQLVVNLSSDADGDGLPDDFEEANAISPGGANLAGLSGVAVTTSSARSGFGADRAIDGDLQTSWLTASGDAANQGGSPFIELTLSSDSSVAQIRLLGNREPAEGFDFFAGVFQVFDAAGNELLNTGEVLLPAPNRDIAIPIERDGVRRVRFSASADESPTPGLGEFEVISRPGGTGLDPTDSSDGALDFDGDGLTNLEEFELGTSLFRSDTDDDGLSDAVEPTLGSNPLVADTDNDLLLDGREVNPTSDSDGDGLINLLDSDSDNDGLPDGVDVALGLDPTRTDSDGDGLPDGSEDSDGDGITNFDELFEGTDPANPDTDGDGVSDGAELLDGTDPLDPLSFPINLIAAQPRVSLLATGTGDRFPVNLSAARPRVSLLVSGRNDDFQLNLTAARPAVSLLVSGTSGEFVFNLTKAQPPVSVLIPGSGDEFELNLVPSRPAASVLISGTSAELQRNVTAARPRVSALVAGGEDAALNVFVARPPLTVEIPSSGLTASPPTESGRSDESDPDTPPASLATQGWPRDGTSLVEGETLHLRAEAPPETTSVEFFVNGVRLATDTSPPFEWFFTVPFEADFLELEVAAQNRLGERIEAIRFASGVEPDPLTTVRGRILSSEGTPVAGATVGLVLSGLEGEFFGLEQPQDSFPDLSGRAPQTTRLVSAINFRNPDNLLSEDTFGLGLSPDFAARFTGALEILSAGRHTFILGSDDSARLKIDDTLVAAVESRGSFSEASGAIDLDSGYVPIEIDFYQAVDASELQLSVVPPDAAEPRVVPPSDLVQSPRPMTVTTDTEGFFSISDVPTILGEVRVTVTTREEEATTLRSFTPVRNGITDVGNLERVPAQDEFNQEP